MSRLPDAAWQKTASFPDWKGETDNSLAMNSMISFLGWRGQGTLWLDVAENVESFELYVNTDAYDTAGLSSGAHRLDFAASAVDGVNTLQVTNIHPRGMKNAVMVYIPYPTVVNGDFSSSGIRPEAMRLVSDLISSDVEFGFPSAQLAIIRNGKLVYENAWGRLNAYLPDGTPNEASPRVTPDTMYDLASVTKMMSVNLALQKLVTDGKLNIEARVSDILGPAFFEDTLEIRFAGYPYPGLETVKEWKAGLTVRDVLCHQAGFPADSQYHNLRFDATRRAYDPAAVNALYSGSDHSEKTRENTLRMLCKTPLMYRPGAETVYSDADYILLGFIVEALTGRRLDEYLRETFWQPMGLTRVAYNPLENGFQPQDCAATELNGNTRDGRISFPGVREYTLQGQVHDEKAWYAMAGVSGHAGLFACARDLAKLGYLMLTGGWGEHRFFSRNVIDLFTAPKSAEMSNWGLGWWRQGEDRRPWHFGTQAPSVTIGHQGWTGTLLMIDPSRQLVIAYLTNKINSPVEKSEKAIRFSGSDYTASTLGFVPQILSIGMDTDKDVTDQLISLLSDMAAESRKLIPEGASPDHPAFRNALSKENVWRAWTGKKK
ncbi:MAG: penicillin binding protein PBP4B [Clostridia bacterium]|nr:penicillin binding protein PBP4B [Clostridia bacterium]